ncbi:hypothetical protein AAK894_04305 [Lachnospiraceae bacterium 46-61]
MGMLLHRQGEARKKSIEPPCVIPTNENKIDIDKKSVKKVTKNKMEKEED